MAAAVVVVVREKSGKMEKNRVSSGSLEFL